MIPKGKRRLRKYKCISLFAIKYLSLERVTLSYAVVIHANERKNENSNTQKVLFHTLN